MAFIYDKNYTLHIPSMEKFLKKSALKIYLRIKRFLLFLLTMSETEEKTKERRMVRL